MSAGGQRIFPNFASLSMPGWSSLLLRSWQIPRVCMQQWTHCCRCVRISDQHMRRIRGNCCRSFVLRLRHISLKSGSFPSISISEHVGLNWLFGAIFLGSWRPWKTVSSSVLVVNYGPCQGQNRWCYFTISHTNENESPNSLSTLNICQHAATVMFYLAKEDYLANRIVKQGGNFWKSF